MELLSVTDMRFWVLATMLLFVGMGCFIAGVKLANVEHRKTDNTRPWVPPVSQFAATRIPEPQPPAGAVVHVHLAPGLYPAMAPQGPVLNGHSIPALAERGDR